MVVMDENECEVCIRLSGGNDLQRTHVRSC